MVQVEREQLEAWAVAKLRSWQPEAVNIRFQKCDKKRCGCEVMMTYQIDPGNNLGRRPGHEHCGYYCPSCEFSNAGQRPVNNQT